MKRIITQSALRLRLKRHLAKRGEALVANRSPRTAAHHGHYMVIDTHTNEPTRTHLELYALVNLAREIDAIKPYEAVEFDDGHIEYGEEALEYDA